ncbi:MAG: hypothetical protein M3P49_01395 [Actinomycetota bacterium]|nr:hypothetical protein [Actinomycetota bacterium]
MTDYAVFDPNSTNPRRDPDYGYCEAVLLGRTENEAREVREHMARSAPGKTFELYRWPYGERVGE